MSERFGPERTRRWLGFVGAAAIIAIPIALIAATWTPLEPHPRGARSLVVDEEPEQPAERPRQERRQTRRGDATPERPPRDERRGGEESAPIEASPDG